MKKNNILGPEVGYIEIADHYTTEIAKEDQENFNLYSPLRPSSAGECERALAYSYAQYKGLAKYDREPNPPALVRTFDLGHAIEGHLLRHLERAFKKMPDPLKMKYKQQALRFFRLPDGNWVEGSLDSTFISTKHKAIIDVKSKKDKYSQFYKSSWDELADKLTRMKSVERFGEESYWVEDLAAFIEELNDAFFANNFYQLNMYFFDEYQFIRDSGIDHAAIIQYNKNDSRLREIRFKPSEKVYEYVKEKFTRVAEEIFYVYNPCHPNDKQTLEQAIEKTQKEFVLGSAKCGFCPFAKQCWPDSNAMKEHFSTWPKKKWPKDTNRLKAYQEMEELFSQYQVSKDSSETLEKLEEKLIHLFDKEGVYKVKFNNGDIYEVKTLKSGGVKGGPRKVLRRGKL